MKAHPLVSRRLFFVLVILFSPVSLRAELSPELASIEEPSGSRTSFSYLELLAQGTIITPGTLTLTNDHFTSAYSQNATGMPGVSLGVAVPVNDWAGFQMFAQAEVGYRYKEEQVSLVTPDGTKRTDKLRLHWLPAALSTKITYDVPGFSFAKPTLILGAGMQWLHQGGQLAGVSDSFWVPYWFVSPGLTFFESRATTDWFGGFSFGTTIYRNFRSAQRIHGMTLDLTIHILL